MPHHTPHQLPQPPSLPSTPQVPPVPPSQSAQGSEPPQPPQKDPQPSAQPPPPPQQAQQPKKPSPQPSPPRQAKRATVSSCTGTGCGRLRGQLPARARSCFGGSRGASGGDAWTSLADRESVRNPMTVVVRGEAPPAPPAAATRVRSDGAPTLLGRRCRTAACWDGCSRFLWLCWVPFFE